MPIQLPLPRGPCISHYYPDARGIQEMSGEGGKSGMQCEQWWLWSKRREESQFWSWTTKMQRQPDFHGTLEPSAQSDQQRCEVWGCVRHQSQCRWGKELDVIGHDQKASVPKLLLLTDTLRRLRTISTAVFNEMTIKAIGGKHASARVTLNSKFDQRLECGTWNTKSWIELPNDSANCTIKEIKVLIDSVWTARVYSLVVWLENSTSDDGIPCGMKGWIGLKDRIDVSRHSRKIIGQKYVPLKRPDLSFDKSLSTKTKSTGWHVKTNYFM